MTEIGIQRPTKRECGIVAVQGRVGRGLVDDRLVGHPGYQLIGKTYSLCWSQWIARPVGVIFAQGLEVVVALPFICSK